MKLSFSQKLWLPLLVSLLCLAALSVSDAYRTRNVQLDERKTDLTHTTEVVLSIVGMFAKQVEVGAISTDEAKKQAIAVIRSMRYGGAGGFFTIVNADGMLLLNPITPGREGTNLLGYRDANGVRLYQNIMDIVRRDGRGFTQYSFAKPNAMGVFPKISYVDSYAPWGWVFINGVYVDDIDRAFHASLFQSLALLAVSCALLGLVVVFLNRGILRALGGEPAYAAEIATRIANNDLAVPVHTKSDDRGSLLYSMKRMREQLAETISSIKISVESIATATSQIATGNQDLSNRTEEQAASLQETAASVEELTATVNQNSDNARQASQVTAQAVQAAERGRHVVAQVIETMQRINSSSDRIADIVGIIESIAFQTNILALNAAVEAARAGEQGRGFAVVASEVRSLAQRSSSASKEIKELIVDSVESVRGGAAFVQTAGEAMNEITRSVQRATDIMGEISAASLEQGKGIRELSQAIIQMDSVTQQNAALVEEAAAAASSLESQTDGLRSSVSMFRFA